MLLSLVATRYKSAPPPATFRFIVSPFVEWIWLGGLIAGGGALLALWATLSARRRRSRADRPVRVGIAAGSVRETVSQSPAAASTAEASNGAGRRSGDP